jgi:hypothetical protein
MGFRRCNFLCVQVLQIFGRELSYWGYSRRTWKSFTTHGIVRNFWNAFQILCFLRSVTYQFNQEMKPENLKILVSVFSILSLFQFWLLQVPLMLFCWLISQSDVFSSWIYRVCFGLDYGGNFLKRWSETRFRLYTLENLEVAPLCRDLANNGLTGTIPTSLGSLHNLTFL